VKKVFTIIASFFTILGGIFWASRAFFDAYVSIALADSAASGTVASALSAAIATSSVLQAQINNNDQEILQLNQQIAQYQSQLQQIGANKRTLQAAINALDLQRSQLQTQTKVTQYQINTTQLQIQQLSGEISNTQQSIGQDQTALGEYLRNLQKDDGKPLLMQVLSLNTLDQVWSDANATLEIQDAVQNEMHSLQTQKTSLTNSQAVSQAKQLTLTSQEQALAAQQQSVAQTVQSKDQLLTETNSQESTYEKLLAAAQAELNSFSAFTQNAGGSKLLANQTACDSWGCYYNQRDAAWGNDPLNGTQYKLASDGCLVTSMAMVLTHYGYRDVTPVTINSNPDDFAAYYPAYLLTTINVDGISATRKASAIDVTLATGNPVIVGLNAYGGTHYVVLVSGSKGNYIMRDPYITNGKDISFTGSYSFRSIFSIAKVIVS
jgi:peptidoglycan hydrolase CwlO-like protein